MKRKEHGERESWWLDKERGLAAIGWAVIAG